MNSNDTFEYARRMDREDPLGHFRQEFVISDPSMVYLDGNSLGRLTKKSVECMESAIREQWGNRLIQSWNEGWYNQSVRLSKKIAQIIGAQPDEVIIADSTSVNLYKLCYGALKAREGKTEIISDDMNFPSDLYILQGMVKELKSRQPGMMTLIGTAISVSFFYSAGTVFVLTGMDFFWELATLIDVMLFGHLIEMKSVLGASRALEELVKVMPTNAHVLSGNQTVEVPVAQLKAGDVVLVRPGEKIPSDGTVVEGKSAVNEALLTGESAPVQKMAHSKVIGGSINGEGVYC